MENSEMEKAVASDETSQLSRNRSFKSKQLVRSQAIRESTSPPRTASPSVVVDTPNVANVDVRQTSDVRDEVIRDDRSENSDGRQQVEIQITSGTWEDDSDQRQRTKRWLGNKQNSRDLLSNNPRIACVCGTCNACPHCRGRRRRYLCPTKQDSGIVCSDECPDCSDTEPSGGSNSDVVRKSGSLDEPTHYCRCPERKDKTKNVSLSRTDSDDRTDMSESELVQFIQDTLNKNARDRMTLLKIEKELHALINDTGRILVKFPVMTSYGRMLVHRCAALFELNHNIDLANKTCVLVSKSGTCGGRIPCTSFKQWCTATFPPSPQRLHSDTTNAKSILKRDTHSLDEPGAGTLSAARSKSLEQREREYERVRRRIFSSDNCNQEDSSQWQWLNSGPIKLLTPEGGSRNKLLKVQSLEGSGPNQRPSLSGRGPVSKSHSFGGYTETPPPRQISRQGNISS
ncbi:hypothetical protein O0L34_g13295 [Tuta absoluta]|nr:hypothetical protein O0L34_g13295 [Tuta absoluta]